MRELTSKQTAFFNALGEIQEAAVQSSLNGLGTPETERLLYDVTFETIYGILELMDGYVKENLKFDLIDKENGGSINENIQLHDVCVDFIQS